MRGVKIVRNGHDGVSEIEVSSVLAFLAKIAGTVLGGLLLAGIVALFNNAESTHENTVAIHALVRKIDSLVDENSKQWASAAAEREGLRLNQEAMKRRLTLLDRKLD